MLLPLLLFIGLSLAFSVRFYTELLAQQGSVFAVGAAQLRKALSVLLSCPAECLAVLFCAALSEQARAMQGYTQPYGDRKTW